MENQQIRNEGDLVLPPNTFAFVLDTTKGKVGAVVGPYKVSLSNTDKLVIWDANTSRFVPTTGHDRAISTFTSAAKGEYIVLSNPSQGASHPSLATATDAVSLDVGRKQNIPGPTTFPLWPGQVAETIPGHHLRHNQYLLTRVHDSEAATENWSSAVVEKTDAGADATAETQARREFTMGQLEVIKGTEVSFYIPPTGIEVVSDSHGSYVRDAITLETLEYCVLLDENGEKRYVQGPDVVFPAPTERFVEGRGDDAGKRKFRAVELNEQSGIYVKVIEDYTDPDGTSHVTGEELFITGAETAIYYPRREHSIIQYGNKAVHYAIALPAGEGRYVLDKTKGTVDLVTGPCMFLPDPRHQVVVLRVLDTKTTQLLYPGNVEALEVNSHYSELRSALPAGQHLSSTVTRGMTPRSKSAGGITASNSVLAATTNVAAGLGGDVMQRSNSYSGPRSLVLDTKYDGAVCVSLWPGYAVMLSLIHI